MSREPEPLYEEWPIMGDAGECIHYCTAVPAITRNCNRVKEVIKKKRKYIVQVMLAPESNANVHALNENIRNLDWLRITWESLHYNPPHKWNRGWMMDLSPNAYRIFHKKSMAVHWKNQNYDINCYEQFPPLTTTSISSAPTTSKVLKISYKTAVVESNNCNTSIPQENNYNIVYNSNYESEEDSENEDVVHHYQLLLEEARVAVIPESGATTIPQSQHSFLPLSIAQDDNDDTDTETVCDPEEQFKSEELQLLNDDLHSEDDSDED